MPTFLLPAIGIMHDLTAKIEDVFRSVLEEQDVELVDLEIKGSMRNPVIRIFVDEPGGISIGRCVALSRELNQVLEFAAILQGNYRLEVSSPGVDRPLKKASDFARNVGRIVKVTYKTAETGTQTQTGKIVHVEDDTVTILADGDEIMLTVAQIESASIQIQWS